MTIPKPCHACNHGLRVVKRALAQGLVNWGGPLTPECPITLRDVVSCQFVNLTSITRVWR